MEISEMTMSYQGFQPSDFTRSYLEQTMAELYNESPNGSFFQAAFSRQNHIFKARIRINSANGHFFAVASGKKLKDVTHKVAFQIRKQLGKWKSLRFNKRLAKQSFTELINELKKESQSLQESNNQFSANAS